MKLSWLHYVLHWKTQAKQNILELYIYICILYCISCVFLFFIIWILSPYLDHLQYYTVNCTCPQGWEFAHLFSEWIACLLPKSEQMSDSLKNVSNMLSHSFLVSDLSVSLTLTQFLWATWASRSFLVSALSKSLMVTHIWWATWAKHSWSPSFGEPPERFAHMDWKTVSKSLSLLTNYERMSKLLMFLEKMSELLRKPMIKFPTLLGFEFPPLPKKICLVKLHIIVRRRNPFAYIQIETDLLFK